MIHRSSIHPHHPERIMQVLPFYEEHLQLSYSLFYLNSIKVFYVLYPYVYAFGFYLACTKNFRG